MSHGDNFDTLPSTYEIKIHLDENNPSLIIDGERFTCKRLMNYIVWKEDGLAQMIIDVLQITSKIVVIDGIVHVYDNSYFIKEMVPLKKQF